MWLQTGVQGKASRKLSFRSPTKAEALMCRLTEGSVFHRYWHGSQIEPCSCINNLCNRMGKKDSDACSSSPRASQKKKSLGHHVISIQVVPKPLVRCLSNWKASCEACIRKLSLRLSQAMCALTTCALFGAVWGSKGIMCDCALLTF